jgi:hypothetical protein
MTASKTFLSAAAIAVIGAFGIAHAQTSPAAAASASDKAMRTAPAAAEQRATGKPTTGTPASERMPAKEKKPMKPAKESSSAAPATTQAARTTPPTAEQSAPMQSTSPGMQNAPATSTATGAGAQMPAASGASRGDKPGAPTSARP